MAIILVDGGTAVEMIVMCSFEVDLDPNLGPGVFKSQVYSLTGVPPERQKLMAKGAWSGVLKDDADMTAMPIRDDLQVMLMGSADSVVQAPQVKTDFVEDMSAEQRAVTGAVLPAGLQNLGNTCYMNATMQVFRKMTEVRSTLERVSALSPSTQLAVSFRDSLSAMDRSAAAFGPFAFIQLLRTQFPQFAQRVSSGGFMQQDAEEFYNVVAHAIGAGLEAAGEDARKYLTIELEESLTCQETSDELPVVRSERVNKLVCNIQGGTGAILHINHVDEGLKLGLEGIVEKFSATLNRNAAWKKIQRISKLPVFLCVQFLRFFWKPTPESRDHTGLKCKILRPVQFTETLDLYDFCSEALQADLRAVREAQEEAPVLPTLTSAMEVDGAAPTADSSSLPRGATGKYELVGVVTHKGRSADSGHYIGWVRQQPGSDFWWKYDDDKVSEVRTAEILDLKGGGDWHTAYLNFYRLSIV